MRTLLFVAMMAVDGCSVPGPAVDVSAEASPAATWTGYVVYNMTSPYSMNGTMPNGQFGNLYTSMPSAPLANDQLTWDFSFCVGGGCFTVSDPNVGFLPIGEVAYPSDLTYYSNGVKVCSNWTKPSAITWHDGTPTRWNIDINATCSDGSISVVGNWRAQFSVSQ